MAVSKPHQLIVVGSDSGWLRLIDVVDTTVEVVEANNCQRSAILPLSTATQHSGIIIASKWKKRADDSREVMMVREFGFRLQAM
ncbi:hypothetical protein Tco_0228304 [Tanacetum coccineum]